MSVVLYRRKSAIRNFDAMRSGPLPTDGDGAKLTQPANAVVTIKIA
jgi:hypothetical protein